MDSRREAARRLGEQPNLTTVRDDSNPQPDLEALVLACRGLKDACNRPSAARTRAQAWRLFDRELAKYSWVQTHGE